MAATVLVLVDIQKDYFPGGAMVLEGADQAGENASRLLAGFRERSLPVVHVRHESVRPGSTFFLPGTEGMEFHPLVAPLAGEPVVLKHYPNSFRETDLLDVLRGLDAERLVVAGMMTLMCVDATVRAAFDLGFDCAVAHDACAARSLAFEGAEIPAAHVHGAFLAALGMVYAQVADTGSILAGL